MRRLAGARVLVTGASGFLGRHVVEVLRARGADVLTPGHKDYDLTREAEVMRLYADLAPQLVVHLAAVVGGIGANRANPGRYFYDNLMMGVLLAEYGRQHGVEKLLAVGTICSYPKFAPVPFREESLWDGYPEETNAPYGLAKKMLLVQAQAYRAQYGFNMIHLLPVNLYGPGDNFHLETSHVIPALIRKCVEARERGAGSVVCWGDGSPTREFLYVTDCARAIVLALERYDSAEPVNLGVGKEIAIRELAALVAEATGFQGTFEWDASKPNGQPRRALDTSRAAARFGFRAEVDFPAGLAATVQWYLANRSA
ncbi:MAG: GDP-L-fucose synthase [Candidatus Rokubacteria bacterium]|nr:GDP-L-fucose synthase [Candidatus Rokubacteria bacterium]